MFLFSKIQKDQMHQVSLSHVPSLFHSIKRSEGITHEEIEADDDFCRLVASLKYIRVNYNPMSPQAALYETLCQVLSILMT